MKKVTKIFAVVSMSIFLAVSNPVVAQTTGDAGTRTEVDGESDADDDGDDEWGLLGLLGLAGLLGLKRRDRDDHKTTTTHR